MKIKVSYQNLESAQLCKAKDDPRVYINGVAFLPDGRISSTNGHVAFVAEGCSSSRKMKDTVIFNIPKKPIPKYEYALIDDQLSIITYFDVNDVKLAVSMAEVIGGIYPDVDKIFNQFKESPCDKIGFNAYYLELIGKVAKIYNPKYKAVTVLLNASINGAVTKISSIEGKEAKIMVMPMRVE